MAQSAGYGAGTGENPLGITAFRPSKCTEAPMLWEHWITRFTWGVIAKHSFNPTSFYFARTDCGFAGGGERKKLSGGGRNINFEP